MPVNWKYAISARLLNGPSPNLRREHPRRRQGSSTCRAGLTVVLGEVWEAAAYAEGPPSLGGYPDSACCCASGLTEVVSVYLRQQP